MQEQSVSSTTPWQGGRFASDLDSSLHETLESAGITLSDVSAVGWTVKELARSLASTPPFSMVLEACVRGHLMTSSR